MPSFDFNKLKDVTIHELRKKATHVSVNFGHDANPDLSRNLTGCITLASPDSTGQRQRVLENLAANKETYQTHKRMSSHTNIPFGLGNR